VSRRPDEYLLEDGGVTARPQDISALDALRLVPVMSVFAGEHLGQDASSWRDASALRSANLSAVF